MSESRLADLALESDRLGRATSRRVRDIVRVFAQRYLLPDDQAARHLKSLNAGRCSRQVIVDLALLYTAMRDDLLNDFTCDFFWPAVREGRVIVTNADVRQLILAAELDGRIPTPWSEEIKRDMAGRVLIALTDFGLVRELAPSKREVAIYRPCDETIVYLAYLLRDRGVTDSSLALQREWMLFGLEPHDVLHRMESLQEGAWFLVQRAGEVTRITWSYANLDEAVDALAR
jgi:hypothetical protein